MTELAAIALGSNIGDREANLRGAIRRVGALGALRLGTVRAVSSFYDTAPVGYVDQARFLNGALLLETSLSPLELMRGLLTVELAMGRTRAIAKGPRVIDLDLLLLGDTVMELEELTLPHPAMAERRFVLEPLAEIAGGMVHPVLQITVSEMLTHLLDQEGRVDRDL